MSNVLVPQPRGLASVLGTQLEPFLRGFQESGFKFDVEEFVEKYTATFAVACPDGSHPLVWTTIHKEYRDLFERQLDTILEDLEIERDEFSSFCLELSQASDSLDDDVELPGTGGARAADFGKFIEALTASEDYELFLKVMFNAVIEESEKLRADGSELPPPPPPEEAAPPAAPAESSLAQTTQEIEVIVPDGYGPGQVLPVEFLGARYELTIPEHCEPGSSFRAAVFLPIAST
eukprot:TRINITY_DN98169_c0_g1_i1.p1 TRINITY_DN98169_c0_g1~~TRINITY_DN98169_c0_g1_i1.p1  ORF type:complete len:245 (+),score=66.62 TRINITY_DN98169_c0_g1_i1:36-737(+)